MIQLPVDELPALCRSTQAPPLLLDVREPWEVALAPIEVAGATLLAIPMGELPSRLAELEPSRPVVCVCHHGVRSLQVARWLERAGFDTVYNLDGGTDAWSRRMDPSVPRY